MKKKIKDLTLEEFDKICDKYFIYNIWENVECPNCPFNNKECTNIRIYLCIRDKYDLEQEMEVGDDA